jgi:hypothetical protein
MRVQLDFRYLAFFRIYGENDTGVQGMRKIFADSVDLLFNVQFQGRGWLCMPKGHGNFDIAHRVELNSCSYRRKNGCRRFEEGSMPIASRYFATVRRAISMESVDNREAIC